MNGFGVILSVLFLAVLPFAAGLLLQLCCNVKKYIPSLYLAGTLAVLTGFGLLYLLVLRMGFGLRQLIILLAVFCFAILIGLNTCLILTKTRIYTRL